MRQFLTIFLLIGSCFVLSCSSNNEEQMSKARSSRSSRVGNEPNLIDLPRAITYKNMMATPEEFMALENTVRKSGILVPSSGKSLSWREVEPKVKNFLSAHEHDKFSSFYRQRFALELLCATDLLSDFSDDAIPVIKRYTKSLVNEENKSVAVFYVALKRLSDKLPEEEITDLSDLAINIGKKGIDESKRTRTSLNLDPTLKQQYLISEQLSYKYIDMINKLPNQ